QFALPDAVERLREARDGDASAPLVVMAASDPANAYALQLEGLERDPLTRPRGTGALLVTRNCRVILAAEGRGNRVMLASGLTEQEVTAAVSALVRHVFAGMSPLRRRKPVTTTLIDGVPANASPHVDAFMAAGFKRGTDGLQWWGEVSRF
ncbi:MAG TPA: hypothetical protein VJ672_14375, partial [Gemmatimonadaceae bacterium]|nr:hypothetical protein [Gemmatimonadaceae bacterium]